ncbi:calcium homeostasis endoplasmic reticulum protein [Condylostylus longicornis]|uniref:calcium homeostasis endoplasmic reticulum protein n=1 Tax=Condylostylus longicornis TaxID=2530218 RepID=UPI00244DD92D|nr:calcium homeostasis endoplasmic reticulum protein [Condylostylus longicornis]
MEPPSPPRDISLKNLIDKLAEFVARNGPEFEQITKQKQNGNPKFEFLFGGKYFTYYQHRVTTEQSILNSQTTHSSNQNTQANANSRTLNQTNIGNSQASYSTQPIMTSVPQQIQPVNWTASNSSGSAASLANQIEAINVQQMALREQIHQSEKNLTAQHSALRQQQDNQIDDAIEKAQNESLELQADDNNIRLADFDLVLQPIIESCTKDSISAGKNWILQHTTDTAKCNVVLQYLLKKALLKGSTFSQKLHLIYLVNDVLHHCVRKNANDLKSELENVVIPMFCSADLIATPEQKAKLTKLLSLWESKAKFFDACVISKLESPESSMQEYKTNLRNKYNEYVKMCIQKVQSTLENYQQQHKIFIQHTTNQIAALENQKQLIEAQIMANNLPNTTLMPPQSGQQAHQFPQNQQQYPPQNQQQFSLPNQQQFPQNQKSQQANHNIIPSLISSSSTTYPENNMPDKNSYDSYLPHNNFDDARKILPQPSQQQPPTQQQQQPSQQTQQQPPPHNIHDPSFSHIAAIYSIIGIPHQPPPHQHLQQAQSQGQQQASSRHPPPSLMAQEYQKPPSDSDISFGAFIEASVKQASQPTPVQNEYNNYYNNYPNSENHIFSQQQTHIQQQQPPLAPQPKPPTIGYPSHFMQTSQSNNFSAPPPSFLIPDLSKPPPNLDGNQFNSTQNDMSVAGDENKVESMDKNSEETIKPTVPYYELPAGLMVPFIRLEDYNYKPLDPEDIRLPAPQPQSERLTSALAAFYSLPSHDRPRDVEGWEKLGLYEYYKVKNAAKKQKEEEILKGERQKSRSPTPVILESPKPKRNNKRRYRSKSRERSKSRSKTPPRRQRSRSNSPLLEKTKSRSRKSPKRNRERDRERDPIRDRKDRERERSISPPSFFGSNYAKSNEFIEESNKGHQMLMKMGWGGSGTGLGSKQQGIDSPIQGGEVRDKKDMYKGVGLNMNDPFENFRKNKGAAFIHRMRTRAEEKS